MGRIEDQIARLADHAMAAQAERAHITGTDRIVRPVFRQWKFVLIGAAAVAAVVAAVVFIDSSDSKRVTPATDVTDATVSTTSPPVTTADTDVIVTPTVPATSVQPTTTEVPSTTATTATTEPLTPAALTLRAGGVGDFDFGSPMDAVVAAVEAEFGSGTVYDHGEANFPVSGCSVHFTVAWAAAGLTLGFTDTGADQLSCTGQPVLVGWQLAAPTPAQGGFDVRLAGGVGIGSSFAAAQRAIPGLELYPAGGEIYSGVPDWAAAGTGDKRIGLEFRGWDFVTAIQRGLIANGADIVADGQLGQGTSEAYQAFVNAHPGLSNQQIFELLGALPPDDVGVTNIAAGQLWWWEPNECGESSQWTLEGEVCTV